MVKEKKNFVNYNGNQVHQKLKNPKFIKEFNEWRENCESITESSLKLKGSTNLYLFFKRHFVSPFVRSKSRNSDFEGEGVNELLTFVEKAVEGETLTVGNAKIIKQMATTLKEWKDTGEDIGGTGIAADPAFIRFTEIVFGRTGKRLKDRDVQSH